MKKIVETDIDKAHVDIICCYAIESDLQLLLKQLSPVTVNLVDVFALHVGSSLASGGFVKVGCPCFEKLEHFKLTHIKFEQQRLYTWQPEGGNKMST
eukprot:6284169-Prymnesium_polylepis.1